MSNLSSSRTKARKRFYVESLLLLLIIGSPFIFKIHEYLPTDPEATISVLGIEITNNGFHDVSIYIWFLLGKAIPLYLLTIWFFTCKHWWYHILLIPICMYAFQIFEVIYTEDTWVDTDNVLWLLPVCMLVIPFVYFIRLKLFDKYVHGIDLEAMNAELEYYKNKEQEALNKVGIKFNSSAPFQDKETDLSDQVPKRALNRIFHTLQHSFKSLF
ncbi:hypothetical protein [Robiginitalea sediminis]|uniref:hypothetical protein n=1 Tax=Robiginitalea sediminis TaxID=1982593 RepID=UPI000B4BDBF1|nr:hypothetical protein [Robiginitalea sediminis]